jgi:hypothetical protein
MENFMARKEELNKVPNAELAQLVSDFESEGATVSKTQNSDGTWKVVAKWND